MNYDTDVLILGAGPVGLTLANELTRFGAKPRIMDKGASIREVSKAMILHTRTQEVLDRVGIARQVVEQSEPLREVVVHAYGKHIGSWDLDHLDSPQMHPVIIGQNRTQHLLLDHLIEHGVAVEWNREAVSFEQDGEVTTTVVHTTDSVSTGVMEHRIRSRYVVGCEGSNSVVRKGCHFTFEGDRYAGEQFIQADCRIRWALPKGRSYLFLTSDGYIMVIEFPHDVVRVFISLPDSKPIDQKESASASQLGAVEATNEQPTLEEIRHHLVRLSGYDCELSEATWLARYRTSHRYTNRFSKGRAFICGDAAHVHVPIGGQGMNTGIQDAFNLGWKLAGVVRGTLNPSVLETYHDERHPVAESLIRGTNFAYTGLLHPSQIKQYAARVFGPFLIGNEKVQGFMRNTLEELKVFYPSSPLNLDLGGARGPKPGERVLDVVLVKAADYSTTSLVEVTRGVSWTLLLFSGIEAGASIADALALAKAVGERYTDWVIPHVVLAGTKPGSAVPGATSILLDALHLAHERYGIAGRTFYLLRPDTYVAARGPLEQQQALFDYLNTLFTAT
jgi:3-(3-hydroxy-phenyl)propionate hydroxylase